MTTITLMRRGKHLVGVSVEGHSGYAEAGHDVVCAAVSAAVQLLECQLADQLNIQLTTHVSEPDAAIKLGIKQAADVDKAQPPLRAFAQVARQWVTQYPSHLTVQEVTLDA